MPEDLPTPAPGATAPEKPAPSSHEGAPSPSREPLPFIPADLTEAPAPQTTEQPDLQKVISEAVQQALSPVMQQVEDLRLKNANLEGQLQARAAPRRQFSYTTPREYDLAYRLLEQQAQALVAAHGEEAKQSSQFLQLQQQAHALRAEFGEFQSQEEEKSEKKTAVEQSVQTFLMTHRISPTSEQGQVVQNLAQAGFPIERIEALIFNPARELAKIKGDEAAVGRTGDALARATEIEPGETRPEPVGTQPKLTEDQAASADLVRRFEKQGPPVNDLIFGT